MKEQDTHNPKDMFIAIATRKVVYLFTRKEKNKIRKYDY